MQCPAQPCEDKQGDSHQQIEALLNKLTMCRRATFRLPHQSGSLEHSIRQVEESVVRGNRLRRSLQATAFLMGAHHRLESLNLSHVLFVPSNRLDGVSACPVLMASLNVLSAVYVVCLRVLFCIQHKTSGSPSSAVMSIQPILIP